MKRFILILAFLLIGLTKGFSQDTIKYHSCNDTLLNHKYYIVCYNKDYRIPNWVSYKMTAQMESNDTLPRNGHFMADSMILKYSARPADYKNSGYDKGHLCAAEDMSWNKEADSLTFLMTNMAPQNHLFNIGSWKTLEGLVRKWAISEGEVYVTAGVIIEKKHEILNKRVAVPSFFYKIILVKKDGEQKIIAFLFKNEDGDGSLQQYIVSVNHLEAITGYDFYPELPDALEEHLEATHNASSWDFKGK